MAFVTASLVLAGCTEKDWETIDNAILNSLPDNLVGTTWVFDGTETYNGVTAKIYSTIHFTSETEGELYLSSVYDGDTVAGSNRITYTYKKPDGVLTLYIEGESAGTMDFTIGVGTLNLKIRNGEAIRIYKLVNENPEPSNELVCSEWELTTNEASGFSEKRVLCFLDNQKAIIVTFYTSPESSESDYEYNEFSYTVNGNQGRLTFTNGDNETFNFSINGNSITLSDNYGVTLTMTRRNATSPRNLDGTSWGKTFNEEYYYEEREQYYPSQTIVTYHFNSNGTGMATQEFVVPILDMDESYTLQFTYTYNRPYCNITGHIDSETISFDVIMLSDMMIGFDDEGNVDDILDRISK